MTRFFLLILLFSLLTIPALAQSLEGSVTDDEGMPIVFASIQVEGSRLGTITNTEGKFSLTLTPGTYELIVKHLGFEDQVVQVKIPDQQAIDIVLVTDEVELDAVEIERGRRDPAYAIMKQVIAHKREFIKQFDTYKCDTYLRISLAQDSATARKFAEKKAKALARKQQLKADSLTKWGLKYMQEQAGDSLYHPVLVDSVNTVLADSSFQDSNKNALVIDPQTVAFVESQSTTFFRFPKQYKSIVNAYRSRSKNGAQWVAQSFTYDEGGGNYSTAIRNPYLFYQDVSEVDVNFYRNLIQAPKLGDRPFVSPLHSTLWTLTYRYHLDSTYYVGGKIHYLISITPKNIDGPYFEGKIVVIDDQWALKSVAFNILPSTLAFFDKFELAHDYSKTKDGRWVLDKEVYTYSVKDGRSRYEGVSTALHTGYELDPKFPKNFFTNELRRTDKEAFERDSAYWSGVRPMALMDRDVQFVERQDSIIAHYRSPEYLKKQDSIFNHLSWMDILFNGISFRNRKHRMRYYFSPILEQMQPFGVGGYRHALNTSISKTWKRYTALYVYADVNYGVDNNDLRGNLRLGYTYNPKKFARAYVKVGDTYSMVNQNATLIAVLGRGNYINKRSIGVGHRMEVANGIHGRRISRFCGSQTD